MQPQPKTDHRTHGGKVTGLRQLVVICAFAVTLSLLTSSRAAQPAPAAPQPAPTPAPAEIQFVKSVFVNSPAFGKDPFFPKSTRHMGPIGTNTAIEIPTTVSFLTLKGISGSKLHRLAIINNKTLE